MTEYIDRKEALNFPFANGIYDHDHANEHFISGCKSYREWLSQIPAADVVERKTGKWIKRDCGLDVECKCSECGFKDFVPPFDLYWFKRKYCPNCGAQMIGGDDDGK